MPISTPLTARLGIQHPILSAPMDVIAGARLTAAVSAAGGFGILGGGYGERQAIGRELLHPQWSGLPEVKHPLDKDQAMWTKMPPGAELPPPEDGELELIAPQAAGAAA